MPLYLRSSRDHYPDAYAAKRHVDEGFVVLSGGYHAGHIQKSVMVRQDTRLDWGGGFTNFTKGGTVDTVDEAKAAIADAFRAGIARAGLTERADAKPGPPERDPPAPTPEEIAAWQPPVYDRWFDRDHPVAIHNPRRFAVYSGELMIGLLNEMTRVPVAGQWIWALSGTRQHPPGFVRDGNARTLDEARAAHAACWQAWVTWAGLEQVEPTRWKSA